MTVTVFTAAIGQTDALKAPTVINPTVRYVCVSDRAVAVPPYEAITIEPGDDRTVRLARRIKILADHPALAGADVVLWHDAAFRVDVDPVTLVPPEGTDILAFVHPDRTQIAEEAEAIARRGLLPRETVLAQVASYHAAGFTQTALTATGFLIRRMTDQVRVFNRLWWREVATWGHRDQLSVDYAAWKAGLRIAYLPGHYRDNRFAKWFKW